MENKTHWRKAVDPNWIGTYVLPSGNPIIVKLKEVKPQTDLKVAGKSKNANVAYFYPNPYFAKPMLLNPTNCKRLGQLTGSNYVEDWKDIDLQLQQELDRMPDGTKDYALRISPAKPKIAPKEKPVFAPDLPSWEKALNAKASIETIKQHYQITSEHEQQYSTELAKMA